MAARARDAVSQARPKSSAMWVRLASSARSMSEAAQRTATAAADLAQVATELNWRVLAT
jgi:hypothetical protein